MKKRTLKKGPPTIHHLAAALAVFRPLVSYIGKMGVPIGLESVRALGELWSRRSMELVKAGWLPKRHGKYLKLLKYCPPHAFCLTEALGNGARCKAHQACPFCRALQAKMRCENIRRSYERAFERHPNNVIWLDTYYRDILADDDNLDELLWLERKHGYYHMMKRLTERSQYNGTLVGSACTLRVDPTEYGSYRIRTAYVVALKSDGKPPYDPYEGLEPGFNKPWHIQKEVAERVKQVYSVKEYRAVSANSLAYMAALLEGYPRGIMYAPVEKALRALEALQGIQPGTTSGVFRDAQNIESASDITEKILAKGRITKFWPDARVSAILGARASTDPFGYVLPKLTTITTRFHEGNIESLGCIGNTRDNFFVVARKLKKLVRGQKLLNEHAFVFWLEHPREMYVLIRMRTKDLSNLATKSHSLGFFALRKRRKKNPVIWIYTIWTLDMAIDLVLPKLAGVDLDN